MWLPAWSAAAGRLQAPVGAAGFRFTVPASKALQYGMPPDEQNCVLQSQIAQARVQGYTGEQCENCGSMRVKQNGTCKVCDDCGMTTGCS